MRDDDPPPAQLSLLGTLTAAAAGIAAEVARQLGRVPRAAAPEIPVRRPRQRRPARANRDGGLLAGASARREAVARQTELPITARRGVVEVGEPVRAALERRLHPTLGPSVKLTITDNRRTMISVQRIEGARQVRLHHMFVDAPGEVLEAVGRYLARGDRHASRLVDRYIAANQHRIRAVEPGRDASARLKPRGAVYDLAEIQRALSARYFGGEVALDITWGRFAGRRRRRARSRRTIRMGTYFIEEKLIRIHPALDQAFVPRYFVEWVVFHEMLHHVVPMPLVNGRRIYHTAEFRERERAFAEYERARAWEEAHLRRLLGTRHAVD